MIGCALCLAWAVAWPREESQQPTWPQERQTRVGAVAPHSAHSCVAGVKLAWTVGTCGHCSLGIAAIVVSPLSGIGRGEDSPAPRRPTRGGAGATAGAFGVCAGLSVHSSA